MKYGKTGGMFQKVQLIKVVYTSFKCNLVRNNLSFTTMFYESYFESTFLSEDELLVSQTNLKNSPRLKCMFELKAISL